MIGLLLVFITVTYASDCGGNCLNGDCPICPCGNFTNKVSIAEVCKRYNWDQNCCRCIVEKSTDGNANAVNITNKHTEVGLFLIDKIFWGYCNHGVAPCSVESNLACAKAIHVWGNRWHAWNAAKECKCY